MKFFRCELHTHTTSSDGKMTPEELVDRALECGYDAIALTDHNTVAGVERAVIAGKERGLTVLRGIEWTTFWGHFTVIGGKSDVLWRDITPDNVAEKIKRAQSLGDIVAIAHPRRMGYPICSGCHCDYDIEKLTGADNYEVWSHYYPNEGVAARQQREQWYSLLGKGHRIAAVYGYDWHNRDDVPPSYAYTYVGAVSASEKDILAGLKSGATYITVGVEVDCKAVIGGKEYEIGSVLPVGETQIKLSFERIEDYRSDKPARLTKAEIRTEKGVTVLPAEFGKEITAKVSFSEYCTVSVYGERKREEQLLAITSAFYREETDDNGTRRRARHGA